MSVLGMLLAEQGRYAEADRVLQEAYDLRVRILGKDHHDTAEAAYDLGSLYALEGKKDQAFVALTQAVDHGLEAVVDRKLDTDPNLKSLTGDPRFAVLVADAQQHSTPSPN